MSNIKNSEKSKQEAGCNATAAPASVIGLPFYNPYTFIPFPKNKPERYIPYPLTIDECGVDYKTGVLDLEVETISPLLCCSPTPVDKDSEHKVYKALTIENDVVMPATSIRGALRTLMTTITGGTLCYIDDKLFLCQGRDAQLGPSVDISATPKNVFLGEVIEPGDALHSGKIRLGETKLVKLKNLDKICKNIDDWRPKAGKIIKYLWIDNPANPNRYSLMRTDACQWKLKLSGKKVNTADVKKKDDSYGPPTLREGAVLLGDQIIELPAKFLEEYQGRNRHGIRLELKKEDLIWLEPKDPECVKILSFDDIKSIQWARWGKNGIALIDIIERKHKNLVPDSLKSDGYVDWITELFGQIPADADKKAAGPFAGKIRPHNLIFFDAKNKLLNNVALAPLSAPHPGCIAFYRDDNDLDIINQTSSPLKGYKVYRNTKEQGKDAPWNYRVQGLYNDQGEIKLPEQQKCNKTVDLLNKGVYGKLRIAFRGLSDKDLALLLTVCTLDWKLGGGKALGLGHCKVNTVKIINEDGDIEEEFNIKDENKNLVIPPKYTKCLQDTEMFVEIDKRIKLYKASQVPVDKLRYPRAVNNNVNKNSRTGLSWFARHAVPKKGENGGLETLWTKDNSTLKEKANGKSQIKAQILPSIDTNNPNNDTLYGYDGIGKDIFTEKRPPKKMYGDIESFDEILHKHEIGKAGENISQNSKSREINRKNRDE